MNEITGLMLRPASKTPGQYRERYDDLRDRRYLDPETVLLDPTRSNALLIAKRENTVVRGTFFQRVEKGRNRG